MAEPAAILVTGHSAGGRLGSPPRFKETRDGVQAQRDYRVNTADIDAALKATGLPGMDEPWSALRADVIVYEREPEYVAGRDDGAEGVGGHTVVHVRYATPTISGAVGPPGRSYTRFVPGTTSVQRIYDARYGTPDLPVPTPGTVGPPDPRVEPIAGGRGTPVGVGTMQVEVVTWPAALELARLNLLAREQRVNQDPVALPPLLRLPNMPPLLFAPGQLRYISYVPDADQGRLRLTQTLEMAPDFLFRDQATDEFDRPSGPVRDRVVYLSAVFAGLFT